MRPIFALLSILFMVQNVYSQRIVVPDKKYEGLETVYPEAYFQAKFRNTSKLIDGNNYYELMYKVPDGWYEGVQQFYREENNKVYKYYQGKESIIYDFNLSVGDTILIENDGLMYKFFPIQTGDTTIYNRQLKTLDMRVVPPNSETASNEKHVWIEGVGDTGFFFGEGEVFGNIKASPLTCVRENSIFYSASTGCPDILSSTNENVKQEPEFIYNYNDKVLIINSMRVDLIEVYSLHGQRIMTIENPGQNQQISLQDLHQSSYVVRIISDGKSKSKLIFL